MPRLPRNELHARPGKEPGVLYLSLHPTLARLLVEGAKAEAMEPMIFAHRVLAQALLAPREAWNPKPVGRPKLAASN